jgi:hypothetical protein
VTKDLKISHGNSLLMRSLLDLTSLTFRDRFLPWLLFQWRWLGEIATASKSVRNRASCRPITNQQTVAAAVCTNNPYREPKKPSEVIKLGLKWEKSECNYVAFVNLPATKSWPRRDWLLQPWHQLLFPRAVEKVPPLHISLKSRNWVVVNCPKKDI